MEIGYRISIAIIYFTQFLGIIYFNKNSNVDNIVFDHKEPKYIVFIRAPWVLGIIASIIVYILDPSILNFSNLFLDDSIRILGIVLGVITDIALFWTLSSLGKNITTTLSVGRNHRLVISGPYKYVRHPMYTIGIILFISLFVISSNWLIGLLGVSFQLFVMIFRTPFEENMLAGHFGIEYVNYKSKTGKFLPKFT